MQKNKLIKFTKDFWASYYREVQKKQYKGEVNHRGDKIYYPNILLIIASKDFFIIEFLGSTSKFDNFTVISPNKNVSVYKYLSQFSDSCSNPWVHLDASIRGFSGLCFARPTDLDTVKNRYPILDGYKTKIIYQGKQNHDGGSLFFFGDNFNSTHFEDCILINTKENIVRCKSILQMYIVRKKTATKASLNELFSNRIKEEPIPGIKSPEKESEYRKLQLVSELKSLFLTPKLRETTIGKYLELHPEILETALKSGQVYYEKNLRWSAPNEKSEKKDIRPDLLVKREDGFCDIYDLKTAELERDALTRGDSRRRRFIQSVYEGLAQLSNYANYFEYPENKKYAVEHYNIKVCDPKLVLVVGSFDNYSELEIREACRSHREITIIDYDTLCSMYLDNGSD